MEYHELLEYIESLVGCHKRNSEKHFEIHKACEEHLEYICTKVDQDYQIYRVKYPKIEGGGFFVQSRIYRYGCSENDDIYFLHDEEFEKIYFSGEWQQKLSYTEIKGDV